MLSVTVYTFDGTENIKLGIKKVVYNPPATVVLWNDGTKTVSKCDKEDKFDKLTGFILCVVKHYVGGKKLRERTEKWVYNTPEKDSNNTNIKFNKNKVNKVSKVDYNALLKEVDNRLDRAVYNILAEIYGYKS